MTTNTYLDNYYFGVFNPELIHVEFTLLELGQENIANLECSLNEEEINNLLLLNYQSKIFCEVYSESTGYFYFNEIENGTHKIKFDVDLDYIANSFSLRIVHISSKGRLLRQSLTHIIDIDYVEDYELKGIIFESFKEQFPQDASMHELYWFISNDIDSDNITAYLNKDKFNGFFKTCMKVKEINQELRMEFIYHLKSMMTQSMLLDPSLLNDDESSRILEFQNSENPLYRAFYTKFQTIKTDSRWKNFAYIFQEHLGYRKYFDIKFDKAKLIHENMEGEEVE